MKALVAIFGSLGVLGVIALAFAPFVLTIYGIILAFKASIVLGVLVLVLEPTRSYWAFWHYAGILKLRNASRNG